MFLILSNFFLILRNRSISNFDYEYEDEDLYDEDMEIESKMFHFYEDLTSPFLKQDIFKKTEADFFTSSNGIQFDPSKYKNFKSDDSAQPIIKNKDLF